MVSNVIEEKYFQLTAANASKDSKTGLYKVKYRLRNSNNECVKESTKRGFKTLKEAKSFIDKLKREHAEAMYKLDNPTLTMTFSELCQKYLVSRMSDKPSTIVERECIINSRILPFFKDYEIKDITQDTISQWHSCFYDDEGNPLFKDTYMRSLHSRLSAILNYGVDCGWLRSNPAKKCSIGTKNADERPVWSPEEYSRFRREIEDEPDAYYAFETLYFTGLRKGELLALTVSDIDFDRNIISITKSLQVIKRKMVITSPKTKMSVRKVRINSGLAEELKEYIASRPGLKDDDRLFFVTKEYLNRILKKGTKKAKLNPITIHCFRHSHITNLIAAGYSPADIAKRVGHESIYITLHYSHAFKNVEDNIADSLDSIMEGLE